MTSTDDHHRLRNLYTQLSGTGSGQPGPWPRATSSVAASHAAQHQQSPQPPLLALRGRTHLEMDEVMMGCAFIGRDGQSGADATVAAALAAGIWQFDTAAAYGQSEELLGNALAAAGSSAEGARVVTKMRGDPSSEPRFTAPDRTAAAAGFSLQVSRQAMGLDKVHTLRFHDPDDERITEALEPGGLLEGLRALRDQGELEHVSLGMCVSPGHADGQRLILRLIREAPAGTFDSAMLA